LRRKKRRQKLALEEGNGVPVKKKEEELVSPAKQTPAQKEKQKKSNEIVE